MKSLNIKQEDANKFLVLGLVFTLIVGPSLHLLFKGNNPIWLIFSSVGLVFLGISMGINSKKRMK
jgi:hypothetical protein